MRDPATVFRRVVSPCVLLAGVVGAAWFGLRESVRSGQGTTLRQAATQLQQNNPAGAHQALKWLLWFEPDHPRALHLSGLSYLRQQNLPAADGWPSVRSGDGP